MIPKEKIKNLVEVNDNKASKNFDIFIILLVILSMITYSIGTIDKLDSEVKNYLNLLNDIFIILFSIEYILRIYTADNKFKYIFSFYGLIDLISILPFYLGMVFDGQYIKSLRLLRVFRLVKLTRYSKTLQKFSKAFYNAREEFVIFAFITIIMFYIAAVGIYQFEHEVQPEAFGSIFDSMWWAVATLTTVGYGDVYPITIGGKIFTTLILIIGLGVVGVPAGIIAAAFTELGMDDYEKNNENESKSIKN